MRQPEKGSQASVGRLQRATFTRQLYLMYSPYGHSHSWVSDLQIAYVRTFTSYLTLDQTIVKMPLRMSESHISLAWSPGFGPGSSSLLMCTLGSGGSDG